MEVATPYQTSGLSGWYQNLNRSQVSHGYLHIFIFISNHRNIHGSSDLIIKWHAAWKHWWLYWSTSPSAYGWPQWIAPQVSHSLKEALKADRSLWNKHLVDQSTASIENIHLDYWIRGISRWPGNLNIWTLVQQFETELENRKFDRHK